MPSLLAIDSAHAIRGSTQPLVRYDCAASSINVAPETSAQALRPEGGSRGSFGAIQLILFPNDPTRFPPDAITQVVRLVGQFSVEKEGSSFGRNLAGLMLTLAKGSYPSPYPKDLPGSVKARMEQNAAEVRAKWEENLLTYTGVDGTRLFGSAPDGHSFKLTVPSELGHAPPPVVSASLEVAFFGQIAGATKAIQPTFALRCARYQKTYTVKDYRQALGTNFDDVSVLEPEAVHRAPLALEEGAPLFPKLTAFLEHHGLYSERGELLAGKELRAATGWAAAALTVARLAQLTSRFAARGSPAALALLPELSSGRITLENTSLRPAEVEAFFRLSGAEQGERCQSPEYGDLCRKLRDLEFALMRAQGAVI